VNGHRGALLGTTLALILLPAGLALATAVSFHVANRSDRTIVSSGRLRGFVLHVPPGHDRDKATPLVISLHGAGLWGAAQRITSRWDRTADAHGFIVVYPTAVEGNGPRVWRVDKGPGLAEDVRFIRDLIDTLRAEYHIDSTRIYADGLSNGGGMAFVLSCALSDRVAAVGMVAAAQTLPWTWCAEGRPVPVMAFHGTADPVVPYDGGTSWLVTRPFPSVPGFVEHWAQRNRCGGEPVDSEVTRDVTRREYTRCADDATVVLYTVRGGGHTWPGGTPLPEAWVGPTRADLDATSLLWEFYTAHPLSRVPDVPHAAGPPTTPDARAPSARRSLTRRSGGA